MALSLDYIGKFVIMTVAIAVAITLILTFRGDILNSTPAIPDNGDGSTTTEVIQIDTSSSDHQQEVQQHTRLCYEKGQQRAETFVCFIMVAEGPTFSGTIADYLDTGFFDVENPGDTVCSQTIAVKYDFNRDGVFLEDYNTC